MKNEGKSMAELVAELKTLKRDHHELQHSYQNNLKERKLAEEEVAKTRLFLDAVIEKSPNSMWISDKHGTLIRCNQACRDQLKIKDEEVVGKYNIFEDNLVQEQGFLPLVKDVFEKGTPARFVINYNTSAVKSLELEQTSEAFLDVNISPIIDENGTITNAIIQHIDVTVLTKKEQALRESEALYRAILNESPDDVTITDLNGKVLMVSNAALPMFGYADKEEILGRNLIEFVAPQDHERAISNLQEMYKGSKGIPTEYLGLRSDGSFCNVEVNGTFVMNEAGIPIYLIFVVRDITRRKEIELELVKAKEKAEESDRLKTAFLENMSHEIRTPMNGILGFSSLLKEQGLSHEYQKKYIEIIEKSGNRLLNIISDLLDIAKIESGQMEVQMNEENLNEKTEYLFNFFKPQTDLKGIQLFVENGLSDDQAVITTDFDKILAIFVNLINNAIKFTYKGYIKFGYQAKDHNLLFFVSDTGQGILKDQFEIIFERFRQGDKLMSAVHEGTGLGLAISKAYAEMLGGNIWVESEIGVGSSFYFSIPSKRYPHASETKEHLIEKVISEQPERKFKILLAEDDEDSVFLFSELIKKYNTEIIFSQTGVQAVEICQRIPDLDLILMDIRLPEMNGYEATRLIRNFNKKVIIIAQTAYASERDRQSALANGCNDYMTKPISAEKLGNLMNQYLYEKEE